MSGWRRNREVKRGRFRRRGGPGHHQHPVHGLRSLRRRGSPAPAGTHPGTAPARLGRAQPGGDLGADQRGHPDRAEHQQPEPQEPRRAGPDQPAGDHGGVEPAYRAPVRQRDRVAGHPDRRHRRRPRPRRKRQPDPAQVRPAARHLLLRRQAALAPGEHRRLGADAERGEALFGTVDTWLLWNLTGGTEGGVHVTDVTNASRTMLMNLITLDWDDELLELFTVPRAMLPQIKPSATPEPYGYTKPNGPFGGALPITGVLGDQQAAMAGQVCFAPGEAKNTYGTGNFLLLNTGTEIVRSKSGLLTTVCFKFGAEPATFALEGSIAVTGAAVQWLRDQLGIISGAAQSETLAAQVTDTAGLYFVPAFSGLFAPYWRADARGAIVGLSRFHTSAHLARATLEAIGYQSRDVAEAMERDSGVRLEVLKVDGGVTANELAMQLQADILGVPVSRPVVAETTALGAAYAAGLATGFWRDTGELRANWHESKRWHPSWTDDRRAAGYAGWRKAVQRTLDWVEVD